MTTAEIVFAVLSGLLINEGCEVSPWLAKKLTVRAARRAYADSEKAEVRAEEWSAVIDERPGKLFKLCTGVWFYTGALSITARHKTGRLITRGAIIAGDQLTKAALLVSRTPELYIPLLRLAARLGSKEALLLLAGALERQGRIAEAMSHLKVLHYTKRWSLAWIRLGALLEATGQIDAAIDVYRTSLTFGGTYARAELVRLLISKDRTEEAIDLGVTLLNGQDEATIACKQMESSLLPIVRQEPRTLNAITRGARAAQKLTYKEIDLATRLWLGGLLEMEGQIDQAIHVYEPVAGQDKLAALRLARLREGDTSIPLTPIPVPHLVHQVNTEGQPSQI
ncbi:hypothetical protein [Microbispora sp. NPDC046933]|uniref:tetratricopeptide repeat protein n=1 Tax=Microbispora sp. NPDC046933 TaxID=3155618 RepID=UPI0033D67F76